GDSTVRYFAMLNVHRYGGIFKKTKNLTGNKSSDNYMKYNFRTNLDVNINKSLLASLNMIGIVRKKQNLGGENTNSIFDLISNLPPNAFPVINPDGSLGGNKNFKNPLGELQSGLYTSNERLLGFNFRLKQDLNKFIK